jgi:hypothetical protein
MTQPSHASGISPHLGDLAYPAFLMDAYDQGVLTLEEGAHLYNLHHLITRTNTPIDNHPNTPAATTPATPTTPAPPGHGFGSGAVEVDARARGRS